MTRDLVFLAMLAFAAQAQVEFPRQVKPGPAALPAMVWAFLPDNGAPWPLAIDAATLEMVTVDGVRTLRGRPMVGGPLGAIAVDASGVPHSVDITAAVPLKAGANIWTGVNDFSRAATTAPFKVGDSMPLTCNSVIREFFYRTANNTLYVCNGPNIWALVTGGATVAPTLRMRRLAFRLSAGQTTISLPETPAPLTEPLVFWGTLLSSSYTVTGNVITLTGGGWQTGDQGWVVYFY